MDWWIIAALLGSALLIPTAYAGFIGAPWAPTRMSVVKKAFDDIGISNKDIVVDLGAGDGSIVREAAYRGARTVGYELSPIMWAVAWVRTFRFKKSRMVYGNFFKKTLPEDATLVFLFLMPKHMDTVGKFLAKQPIGEKTLVLSYAFAFRDIHSLNTYRQEKCAPLYLYELSALREHYAIPLGRS